jgi:hypothetical protein
MAIDLSKVTLEELMEIHNEVLRNVAIRAKTNLGAGGATTHDSHAREIQKQAGQANIADQVADVFRRSR